MGVMQLGALESPRSLSPASFSTTHIFEIVALRHS